MYYWQRSHQPLIVTSIAWLWKPFAAVATNVAWSWSRKVCSASGCSKQNTLAQRVHWKCPCWCWVGVNLSLLGACCNGSWPVLNRNTRSSPVILCASPASARQSSARYSVTLSIVGNASCISVCDKARCCANKTLSTSLRACVTRTWACLSFTSANDSAVSDLARRREEFGMFIDTNKDEMQ